MPHISTRAIMCWFFLPLQSPLVDVQKMDSGLRQGSETGVHSKEEGQENIRLVRNDLPGLFVLLLLLFWGDWVQFSSTSRKYLDLVC